MLASANEPLNTVEKTAINEYVLPRYAGTFDDAFKGAKPSHVRAAVEFVKLIRECEATLNERTWRRENVSTQGQHVVIVPGAHLESRGGKVGVIYDGLAMLAEEVQLGYQNVYSWYQKYLKIQEEYGVWFEMTTCGTVVFDRTQS